MTTNQWQKITPPQTQPEPEMRLDGPSGYVSCKEITDDGPPMWHLWVMIARGVLIPKIDGKPHPLAETLDHAIGHLEAMLAWARERRAELPEAEGRP